MNVVFVGPSLPEAQRMFGAKMDIRPPACQGDVERAMKDGASAIGIIDGQFEFVGSVWHKELLHALSRGLPVYGAASMGALRAAECQTFGMVGIGEIYRDYASGRRLNESDVAVLFGPAELDYINLTIPIVNVDATVARIRRENMMADSACDAIEAAARSIFFKDRTWRRVLEAASLEAETAHPVIRRCWTDQKKLDAMALFEAMTSANARPAPVQWTFQRTKFFSELYPSRASEYESEQNQA